MNYPSKLSHPNTTYVCVNGFLPNPNSHIWILNPIHLIGFGLQLYLGHFFFLILKIQNKACIS